jgi:hypothetical protein
VDDKRVGERDERAAHLHNAAEGHRRVGIDQRTEDDVMEIHHEQNHHAGKGDEARKGAFGRIFEDVAGARLRIADHHRKNARRKLQAERVEPGQHAVHHADQRFAEDKPI